MPKVVVIGHKSVKTKPLEDALKLSGVLEASSIHRKPEEIDSIISSVIKNNQIKDSSQLPKMWDGLALNLFLENMEKTIWGWCNPEALYSAEYWKETDSDFTFILTYDHPAMALIDQTDTNNFKLILDDWVKYNKKILQFYLANKDCSILLHQKQFNIDISNSINSNVMALLGHGIHGLHSPSQQDLIPMLEQSQELTVSKISHDEDMQRILLQNIVDDYIEVIELYEQIQSVSDLPLKKEDIASHLNAWETFQKIKSNYENKQVELTQALLNANTESKSNNEKLEGEINQLEDEGKYLLKQLHVAQEEVEVLFIERNHLLDRNTELETNNNISIDKINKMTEQEKCLEDKASKLLALEKQNLSEIQKLKASMELQKNEYSKQKSILVSDNVLLLEQMHAVQEELEKFYLASQAKAKAKAKQAGPYGVADRVKSQLSYQIGAVLIDSSRSIKGCCLMPLKLTSTYFDFKKDKKQKIKQPPLHTYQDYYDVARIQKHLSYRLGYYVVHNIGKPWKWFVMPWGIQKIIKDFHTNQK